MPDPNEDRVMVATELTNYEVAHGRTLIVRGFPHPTGDVLAAWYLDFDGGLAARVAAGHVVPTSTPVNVAQVPPEPKVENDPLPALAAENNRLAAHNRDLAESARTHAQRADQLDRDCLAKDRRLGAQTVEVDRLRTMLDDAQKRCEELDTALDVERLKVKDLTADLEAATKPAKPAKADAKLVAAK